MTIVGGCSAAAAADHDQGVSAPAEGLFPGFLRPQIHAQSIVDGIAGCAHPA